MKIHRFFLENHTFPNEFVLTDADVVHQVKNVLRIEIGEKVAFFGGKGIDYIYELKVIGKKELTFNLIEERLNVFHPRFEITLAVSLVKRNNFELIVEKGTELGITTFIPLLTERSEKKGLNLERLKKIAIESTEQCGRSYPPLIHNIHKLTDLDLPSAVILDPRGENKEFKNLVQNRKIILIGPEGGWTDSEIKLFRDRNAEIVSCGSQVLRTETAAIAISSILLI